MGPLWQLNPTTSAPAFCHQADHHQHPASHRTIEETPTHLQRRESLLRRVAVPRDAVLMDDDGHHRGKAGRLRTRGGEEQHRPERNSAYATLMTSLATSASPRKPIVSAMT